MNLIPIVLAIVLHEAAHAYVAKLCGDPTAYLAGRMSLNPLRHVDPIGTVLVPLVLWISTGVGFGWARSVPVNFANLDRRGVVLTCAAGPASNVLQALAWYPVPGEIGEVGVIVNLFVAILNLLPIPPLDGWRILMEPGGR